MVRKIFITLLMILALPSCASDNYLDTVILSELDGKTSVVFRTDDIAKIKKQVLSKDRMLVTLKGVKQSSNVSTLYKNISGIDGILIQNSGNDVQVLFDAPNISKSDIIFETPDSSPIKAVDSTTGGKFILTILSVSLLVFMTMNLKLSNNNAVKTDITEQIKEREKELYKNFQKEISTLPSLNYKLKSYRKHVLKGETIRSYENRMTKIS